LQSSPFNNLNEASSELAAPESLKKGMVENVDYVLFPAPVAHQVFMVKMKSSICLISSLFWGPLSSGGRYKGKLLQRTAKEGKRLCWIVYYHNF